MATDRPGLSGRPAIVNIRALIDAAKCFQTVRSMR
jgi:hypothetical protein